MLDVSLKTVLYADDEDNDVFIMRRAFRKLALRANLQVVTDGGEARDYLAGDESYCDRAKFPFPHLVVLDLKMPRLSGLEVLQWARTQPTMSRVPIVLWTSSNQDRDIQAALQHGANGFFVKPPSLEKWVQTVDILAKSFLSECPAPSWLQLEDGPTSESMSRTRN